MVLKLGTQFGADFEAYKNLEDGQSKSEAGFMAYLAHQGAGKEGVGEINRRFRSYLYSSVLESHDNAMSQYVSASNRSSMEKPLTIDMLSKSLFSCFLHREPTSDNMAMDAYMRDAEMSNVVALMNMLHECALREWNPKPPAGDQRQVKLSRIFGSKSMMAWSELLRDALCGKLDLQDAEDRVRPFYRHLSEHELEQVKQVVNRLMNWKRWDAPPDDDIDRVLSDKKTAVKDWFRTKGLTTGYLMGAPE